MSFVRQTSFKTLSACFQHAQNFISMRARAYNYHPIHHIANVNANTRIFNTRDVRRIDAACSRVREKIACVLLTTCFALFSWRGGAQVDLRARDAAKTRISEQNEILASAF